MLKTLFLFAILVVSSSNARNLDAISIHLSNVTSDGDLPVEIGNYSLQKDEVKQFIYDYKLADLFKVFLAYNGTRPNLTDVKSIDEKTRDLKIVIKNWKSVSPEIMKKVGIYLNDKVLNSVIMNYLKGKFPEKNVTAIVNATTATTPPITTTQLPILKLLGAGDDDGDDLAGDLGDLSDGADGEVELIPKLL